MQDFLTVTPPLASIAVFVAPYRTVLDITKNQTTGDLPALTFVSMSVMSAIWGTYGGLRGDMTVLVPNLVGCGLSLYYLHVFESNTPKGVKASELTRWYQLGIALLVLILLEVTFGDLESAAGVVGTCGAVLSVIFSISPLLAIPAVRKSGTPDAIPLPTAGMMFVNAALWAGYGYVIVDDRTIYLPNVAGLVSALIQLGVHLMFRVGIMTRKTSEGVKVASL